MDSPVRKYSHTVAVTDEELVLNPLAAAVITPLADLPDGRDDGLREWARSKLATRVPPTTG
jgi:hypothetical protein